MPRKTQTTIVKEEIPDTSAEASARADDSEFMEVTEREDPNSIANFLSRIGNDVCIKIYRKDITGKIVFCGSVAPEYFSEEWLQATYGAGNYALKAYSGSQYVQGGSRQINIGAPGHKPDPMTVPNPAYVPPAIDPMAFQLETMREEMRMQRDLMFKLIEKGQSAPGVDYASLLASIASVAKMFIPAPVTPVNPLASVDSLLGLLKTGIEIGQTGNVDGEKGGVMSYLKDLAPVIGEVLSNMLPSKANGGGGGGGPVKAPSSSSTTEPKQMASAPEAERALAMLRAGISYLKTKAVRGADPGLYIDFINDSLDDPQWNPLIQLVNKPYDDLATALDPELLNVPFRPWFETLFNGIREELAERSKPQIPEVKIDESANQPATGETGDGTNPVNNG